MVKEYRKIDKGHMGWNTVVTNIYPDTSSFEEKRIAIEAVILIKEKICGKI